MNALDDGRARRLQIALVTQGFCSGGGVPTMARWLRRGLEASGNYSVDIYDLATSRRDTASRRLSSPRSWLQRSLSRPTDSEAGAQHWGANAVELEFMRYRPRRELTRTLQNYDVIHVVAGGPALAAAVVGAHVPIVLQAATTAAWERRSGFSVQTWIPRMLRQGMTTLTSRIERTAIRNVDVVLVLNDAMIEHVRALGQRNVLKAPPGVDTDRFTPASGGWRSEGHFLSVCRLADKRKGLNRMILAYAEMVAVDTKVPDLVLAGRGVLALPVAELVRDLGLASKVHIRTDIGMDELVRLYQGASMFLQTSYEEGLGISILEAMACGLPVVSTDTAGTRETVVSGKTGWLVEQGSDHLVANEVAQRALTVLRGGQGSVMGAEGRDRCFRLFSHRITLGRFTSVYDYLLDGAPLDATALISPMNPGPE